MHFKDRGKLKKPTAQQQILEDFACEWEQHTGRRYLINWPKEVKFANILIEMSIPPDEYMERKRIFFSDKKWWEYGQWGFATFVNNINKCVPQPRVRPVRARESQAISRTIDSMEIVCVEHKVRHNVFQVCPACQEESERELKERQ